ncbi:hypothetical protein Emed_006145 [Eimeria media]
MLLLLLRPTTRATAATAAAAAAAYLFLISFLFLSHSFLAAVVCICFHVTPNQTLISGFSPLINIGSAAAAAAPSLDVYCINNRLFAASAPLASKSVESLPVFLFPFFYKALLKQQQQQQQQHSLFLTHIVAPFPSK